MAALESLFVALMTLSNVVDHTVDLVTIAPKVVANVPWFDHLAAMVGVIWKERGMRSLGWSTFICTSTFNESIDICSNIGADSSCKAFHCDYTVAKISGIKNIVKGELDPGQWDARFSWRNGVGIGP